MCKKRPFFDKNFDIAAYNTTWNSKPEATCIKFDVQAIYRRKRAEYGKIRN